MHEIIQQTGGLCRIALPEVMPVSDRHFLSQFYTVDKQSNWQLRLSEADIYCLTEKTTQLSLRPDFRQSHYRHRQRYPAKEPLLKAVKIRQKLPKTVIDATPGVLKDSLMLAGRGIRVIAIERHPLLYVMIKRALTHVNTNIRYYFGDAKDLLADFQAEIIYLDPMYPPRRKSAQVKKEMQILHRLVGADDDADRLFDIARQQHTRLVVKRPSHAKPLGGIAPTFSSSANKRGATRFDIYLP